MEWAKTRPTVRFDLAGSNLLECATDELRGTREASELGGLNPDGWPPLIDAIATHYGVTADRVATAAGCSGANFLAFAALVRPGDEVLVERPAYDPLLGAPAFLAARVHRFDRVHEEGWAIDPDRVRAALTARTRLIVITSPHNPSGVVTPPAVLDEIARAAEAIGAHVLVDEVYLDAVYAGRPAPAATRGEVFLSTNSLTKAYGLSGLRAGWVIASPRVTRAVRRVRDIIDVSAAIPADRLARLAFEQLDALRARARAILQPNAMRLSAFLASRPELDCVPPHGGTIAFPRLRGETDTRAFAAMLAAEHGVAVAPGHFFEAPGHFRIAYGCSAMTLEGGLRALAAALDARARH
jgi:hypothetical protein